MRNIADLNKEIILLIEEMKLENISFIEASIKLEKLFRDFEILSNIDSKIIERLKLKYQETIISIENFMQMKKLNKLNLEEINNYEIKLGLV